MCNLHIIYKHVRLSHAINNYAFPTHNIISYAQEFSKACTLFILYKSKISSVLVYTMSFTIFKLILTFICLFIFVLFTVFELEKRMLVGLIHELYCL